MSVLGLRDVFLLHSSSSSAAAAAAATANNPTDHHANSSLQTQSIFPLLPPFGPGQPPSGNQNPSGGSFPLRAFEVVGDEDQPDSDRGRIQLWQHYQKTMMMAAAAGGGINIGGGGEGCSTSGGGGIGGGGGAMTCQDCGNQAKKDCTHRRCRTCCKSRGYDCNTHVKSTWVPASRRRERQQQLLNSSSGPAIGSGSSSGKKPRLGAGSSQQTATSHTSTSATTPSRSFDTCSSHQQAEMEMGGLPGQVTAPAVFKCVRVTSIEDGEDEYAYQAVLKIGGRQFKGFLYDQGLDEVNYTTSTSPPNMPRMSDLHLGGNRASSSSATPILDARDAYAVAAAAAAAAAGSTGMLGGGSSYGNPMN